MNILDQIIQQKKLEVASARKTAEIQQFIDMEGFHRKTVSLKDTLLSKSGIIAEFKRRSPSKGVINSLAEIQTVTADYQRYGASAVSVLTDAEFFGGSLEDLGQARSVLHIPLLRKDFMIDEYQFYEAKAYGADVVLLIAACLSPSQVQEFTEIAHGLKLEVLLEIHSEVEIGHTDPKVDFVGINNRNLKDFKVDLEHSIRLKNALPTGIAAIAESGIYSVKDFKILRKAGFDGFLMGEYFMRDPDPGKAFEKFISDVEK